MSRRRQANFFNKSSRSKTDNSQQQKSLKKKKNEGNSEFIKSKFDLNYEPKFRPIKVNRSSYASKKQMKKIKIEDLNQLAIKTQEQIKEGKKIIIDWSQQHNFRTTRFPSLDDRFTQSKRAITQQIHISNLDTPKNARYIQYLNKLEKDNNYKEIVAKGEHLRTLISSSILQKRRLRTKISMKLKNYNSQLISTPNDLDRSQNLSQSGASINSDPHFNYAIIEEVEEKNKEFFMKNNEKILKAIDYQKNLLNCFGQMKKKSKNKVDQIHERIICKSKLTLLKSELIRKFKEVKEGFLEDCQMSRHSKNNTSQSIFTYGQKQKLKGQYGTIESRISQDSIKKFEMCTICNHQFVEPVCCSEGHVFCRECVIQYMVKQKKKIAAMKLEADAFQKRAEQEKQLKKLQQSAKKAVEFEKYDNFENLVARTGFSDKNQKKQSGQQKISAKQSKPVGVYEITGQKQKYVKSSFWAIQNTPSLQKTVNSNEISEVVKCAGGSDHKLTLKKLRSLIVKKLQNEYCCGICSKEIRRQKIGSYKCGHIICEACKSQKCELCGKKEGWIDIESSSSSFAQHNKAEVKTYTHAFYI